MCEHSATLGAVLDVGRTLPPAQHWRRWLGEPLKAVIIHTSAFLSNKRGFPVLPKAHQDLVSLFFRHNVQVRARERESGGITWVQGLEFRRQAWLPSGGRAC